MEGSGSQSSEIRAVDKTSNNSLSSITVTLARNKGSSTVGLQRSARKKPLSLKFDVNASPQSKTRWDTPIMQREDELSVESVKGKYKLLKSLGVGCLA